MTTQPALPNPIVPTDIEQAYIDETPAKLFPDNQNSNYGLHRKIFCDILTDVENQIQLLYNERWPSTSELFLSFHEEQVGLPTNPSNLVLGERRSLVLIRNLRGPFTPFLRNRVIEFFLQATFGFSPAFGISGIPILEGIPLFTSSDFSGDLSSLYTVVEDIPNFHYTVNVDETITIDIDSLTRELKRITTAGITFDIIHVPFAHLSWTPSEDDGGSAVTSFNIYRGETSGSEVLIGSVSGDTFAYVDNTVEPLTTYFYEITSVNDEGESDFSNEVEITI